MKLRMFWWTSKDMSLYDSRVPRGYKCSMCNRSGIKLWRHYNTFMVYQELFCADCAMKHENINGTIDEEGKIKDCDLTGTVIGHLVPAIPTEECDTFWGYTSAPIRGVRWWKNLPTKKEKK